MSIYKRWSTSLSSVFWLVMTAVLWIAFAPTQAGGQASYIVVIGKSMEPSFHLGDLILVQKDSTYQIGDIVAYKNAELKNNVFHRIIGVENSRYIVKGDNNSWVDTYQPRPEEVIGKLWLYVPGAGNIIQRIRTPFNMALIVGTLTGIFLFTSMTTKPKGGKHMNKKPFRERIADLISRLRSRSRILQNENASPPDPQTGSDQPASPRLIPGPPKGQMPEVIGNNLEPVFFALGLIAFTSLILGIISLTRPVKISQPDDITYQHIGVFSYSASAPAGIYDSNTVQRGEPIFPKVTCSARVDFHYSLFGDSLQDITGTYEVTAQILEPQSGWQRTVILLPETSFSGASFDLNTNVDLCQIVKLTESMEQGTEYHPTQYTLVITPHVTISGKVAERDLQDVVYEPQLNFKFDRSNFSMIQMDMLADPFNQSQAGFIRETTSQLNTMSIFGLQPTILTLRLIGFIGLVLSLIGMGMLGQYLHSLTSISPQAIIQMKYSSLVVDVQSAGVKKTAHAVDVKSIDDLAKLAERYNAMILHEAHKDEHVYLVHTAAAVYRFSINKNTSQLTEEAPK